MNEDHCAYILVEYEPYWKKRIEQSRKGRNMQSFVRRGRRAPEDVETLLFYVTKPIAEIRGQADFLRRIAGKPDELWNLHSSETVFESRQQYDDFVGGKGTRHLHSVPKPERIGKTHYLERFVHRYRNKSRMDSIWNVHKP